MSLLGFPASYVFVFNSQDKILKLIAVCHWHLHPAVRVMDESDIVLTPGDCSKVSYKDFTPAFWKDLSQHLEIHLIAWQHLACACREQGLHLFKLRPKHHQLDHLGQDAVLTRLNCGELMACWNDESFLGYIKQIAIRCHGGNTMVRLFQRYILFLSLRWRDSRK